MGEWIRSRNKRCTKCGSGGLTCKGRQICKVCRKYQKLQTAYLLRKIPRSLGPLPQSYFDVVGQLNRQYKCMGCRTVTYNEMIRCETCMEHQYCSFQCLHGKKEKHRPVCLYLLMAKRRSNYFQQENPHTFCEILSHATILDYTGNLDVIASTKCGLEFPTLNLCAIKGLGNNDFTKKSQGVTGTSPDIIVEEYFLKKTLKPSKSTSKKVIENVRGHEDMHSVDATENLTRNNETKDDVFNRNNVEWMIASGTFAGLSVRDTGMSFGEGWWKCSPHRQCKQQQLLDSVNGLKVLASQFWDTSEPVTKLKFADFYGSLDSDEEQDRQEYISEQKSDFSDIDKQPCTTSASNIIQEISATNTLDTNKDLCGVSDVSSLASASLPLMQIVRSTGELPEKELGLQNGKKNECVMEVCMFCYLLSYNIKICARCGYGKYCSKACQVNGFAKHKKLCKKLKEFNLVKSKIPSLVTGMLQAKYGTTKIDISVGSVPDFWLQFFHCHLLVKIVRTTRFPFPGFFCITVKDGFGSQTDVLLRHPLACSMFHTPDFGKPIVLTECMAPGNYILLINVRWSPTFFEEDFLLTCDEEEYFFILMN